MAFDLYVFDLFAAPRDRHDFLDWVSRNFRSMDGPLAGDADRLTPALKAWHREISQTFPGAMDPNHFEFDSPNAARNATYRFAQSAIQASFEWESSGPALMRAKRAAQAHGVGLFEASNHDAAVWMVSSRGRWEVVHRADDQRSHG